MLFFAVLLQWVCFKFNISISQLIEVISSQKVEGIFLCVLQYDSNKKQWTNQPTKETNKHFRSTISQLYQVWYLRNFQIIFLGVSHDDSNKKTNKQTIKLIKKIISTISNLYQTFRKSSCGYPKMIKTKNRLANKLANNFANQC